jgi:DNA polymerase-3 subunit gamma/tau
MQTLYRKYRARTFKEIIGQAQIVKIIRQSVIESRVAHAYLFTGPRGTGKTSLARLMAKVLNCTDKTSDGDCCDKCKNCLAINKGNFMDLMEIDAASNRGIEEIRSLKENIGFLPVEGKNKVYIIDEVHMLTTEAFNALLKTLEEPPTGVVFILATTEPQKLPLTIISRTQRFDLKYADNESLKEKLEFIIKSEGYNFNPSGIDLIVRAGQGSFRDAETVLEKVITSIQKGDTKTEVSRTFIEEVLGFVPLDKVKEFLDALIKKDLSGSLDILHSIWAQGINLSQFVKESLDEAREEILIQVRQNNESKKDTKALLVIIKELNQAINELKTNLINILPIEIAIFNITGTEGNSRPAKIAGTEKIEAKKDTVQRNSIKVKEIKSEDAKIESPKTKSLEYIEPRDVSLSEQEQLINDNWEKILLKAKDHNHFLTAILTGLKIKLENGQIYFITQTSFHKQRLDNIETRKLLTKIINEICGINVDFKCIIDKSKTTKHTTQNNEKLVEEIFN